MQNMPMSAGAKEKEAAPFYIHADMLPPGYAAKLKAGDDLELKVVSPVDQDGEIGVVCEHHDEDYEGKSEGMSGSGEGAGEDLADWENEARKITNPQAPEDSTY